MTTLHNPLVTAELEDQQVQCIDAIEQLQSIGVGHYIDLPQMVLVGDQSSGKSSLLDAITGIRIPAQDGLCTRYPMQLVLRRGPTTSITTSIVAAPDRTPSEIEQFRAFTRNLESLDELPDIMADAAGLMDVGVSDGGRRFCIDALRIEFTGPNCLNLSLTDLPGLFLTSGRQQKEEDVDLVRDMVVKHIERPRTVVLVVVSAKSERVNQNALRLVKKHDPNGQRTLGVITKPDFIKSSRNRATYDDYLELLNNTDHRLELDWHIVKNRSDVEKDFSSTQRDTAEARFFEHSDWADVPGHKKGIRSLRTRLCQLHFDVIKDSVPGLIADADRVVQQYRAELSRLPETKASVEAQRGELTLIGQDFTTGIKSALANRNTYGASGDVALRGHAEKILTDFVHTLEKEKTSILTKPADPLKNHDSEEVTKVVEEIRARNQTPGQLDSSLMSDLFYGYSADWPSLVYNTVDRIVAITKISMINVLKLATPDQQLVQGIEAVVVVPATLRLQAALRDKTAEIIGGHREHGLIDFELDTLAQVKAARATHVRNLVRSRVQAAHNSAFNFDRLFEEIYSSALDTDGFTAVETIACTKAHYEAQLSNLRTCFKAENVMRVIRMHVEQVLSNRAIVSNSSSTLSDADIRQIFGPAATDHGERHKITTKLEKVEAAAVTLRMAQKSLIDPPKTMKRLHQPEEDQSEAETTTTTKRTRSSSQSTQSHDSQYDRWP